MSMRKVVEPADMATNEPIARPSESMGIRKCGKCQPGEEKAMDAFGCFQDDAMVVGQSSRASTTAALNRDE